MLLNVLKRLVLSLRPYWRTLVLIAVFLLAHTSVTTNPPAMTTAPLANGSSRLRSRANPAQIGPTTIPRLMKELLSPSAVPCPPTAARCR